MAIQKLLTLLFPQLILFFLFLSSTNSQLLNLNIGLGLGLTNSKGLQLGFYKQTCPNADLIVHNVIQKFISSDPTLAAPLLRMHFHDCFVRGCDGSVLLNSTSTNQAEKDAIPNQTLRGAHTIGIGHCSVISDRLYNFSGRGDTDPSLNATYAAELKTKCKPGDSTTVVEMDPGSSRTFDSDYYNVVNTRRGIFQSDAALLNDIQTRTYVLLQSSPNGTTFKKDLGSSMVKLGRIGVLTGSQGEIRKQCALVN
ncbi:hypothetical protein JCGZ_03645 [Jatropha curcas]|uniref:peroxidase n=1 Tax=Jatropha curcas TaxID=180498 RepID=A0A067KY68_JATCU|nr:hypothetical protein JCGZ_03645 [Jatropha curcas]